MDQAIDPVNEPLDKSLPIQARRTDHFRLAVIGVRPERGVNNGMCRFISIWIFGAIYILPSFKRARSMLREQHRIWFIILQIDRDHFPIAFVMVDTIRSQTPIIERIKEVILAKCLARHCFGRVGHHIHDHAWCLGDDVIEYKFHHADRCIEKHHYINGQQNKIFHPCANKRMRMQKKPNGYGFQREEKKSCECSREKTRPNWGCLGKDDHCTEKRKEYRVSDSSQA